MAVLCGFPYWHCLFSPVAVSLVYCPYTICPFFSLFSVAFLIGSAFLCGFPYWHCVFPYDCCLILAVISLVFAYRIGLSLSLLAVSLVYYPYTVCLPLRLFCLVSLIGVAFPLIASRSGSALLLSSNNGCSFLSLWHCLAVIRLFVVASFISITTTNTYRIALLLIPTRIAHLSLHCPLSITGITDSIIIAVTGHSAWRRVGSKPHLCPFTHIQR